MQTAKIPSESVIEHYSRLKDAVANGDLDLDRSEIYSLIFGKPASIDYIRRTLRALDLVLETDEDIVTVEGNDPIEGPHGRTTIEIHKDGSQSRLALVQMREEDTKNPEFLLKIHGYDPEYWELKAARSNIWNTSGKKDGKTELFSSKITVKPLDYGLDYGKIAAHFEKFAEKYVPEAIAPLQYEYGAELLVPCLFDVHFSKLGDEDETGEQYNWEVARERVIHSVRSYVDRLRNRKFEQIMFVVGNDYFNCEPTGSTIGGTKQDTDLRYGTMFNKGVETLIEATDILSQLAPVEVILVQGNHAGYTEYYAACVLDAWYRQSTIVQVDFTPAPRKYRRFGKTLLGFAHGDSEKERIFGLMQYEAAEEWGVTTTREFLLGHLHSEGTTEKNGVVVRRIPSLSGNDHWHTKSGFTTTRKRSMAFIYDKENGLVETHYINI